ncbi:MFS transporter [Streptomyces fagopyri]|uniref:MFS transporter n=1 Tax=Streptomyces fagopyri TaxID=2662397 RepID=UPI0037FB3685
MRASLSDLCDITAACPSYKNRVIVHWTRFFPGPAWFAYAKKRGAAMTITRTAAIRPGRALFALTLAVSVVLLGSTILNVALPALHATMGAGATAQQWILNGYTLTFAGFLLVAGNAGDRFGLKRLLFWGTAAFAVTTAICGSLDSVTWVIVLRALMGVAAAAIMPTSLAVILRIFPAENRARAIAVWAAASGLSISLGPLLGGALLSAGLWWGSVLELVAVLGLLAFLSVVAWVPDVPGSGTGELRMLPVAGSLSGISLLVYGVVHVNEGGWGSTGTWLPVLAGLLILSGLVLTEIRHREPLIDVALFRHRSFTVAVAALTLSSFVMFGYMYVVTFYLQVERGYSPLRTGLLLIPLSGGLALGAPLSRLVTRRIGARATMTVGLGLITVALAGAVGLGSHTPASWFMLDAFVLSGGFALVLSPGITLASSSVPADRAGAGSALLNTLRQLGSALGVAVLGSTLWSHYASMLSRGLGGVPAHVRVTAASSLTSALAAGPTVAHAADKSFLGAMHEVSLIAAGVTAAAFAATALIRGESRRRGRAMTSDDRPDSEPAYASR